MGWEYGPGGSQVYRDETGRVVNPPTTMGVQKDYPDPTKLRVPMGSPAVVPTPPPAVNPAVPAPVPPPPLVAPRPSAASTGAATPGGVPPVPGGRNYIRDFEQSAAGLRSADPTHAWGSVVKNATDQAMTVLYGKVPGARPGGTYSYQGADGSAENFIVDPRTGIQVPVVQSASGVWVPAGRGGARGQGGGGGVGMPQNDTLDEALTPRRIQQQNIVEREYYQGSSTHEHVGPVSGRTITHYGRPGGVKSERYDRSRTEEKGASLAGDFIRGMSELAQKHAEAGMKRESDAFTAVSNIIQQEISSKATADSARIAAGATVEAAGIRGEAGEGKKGKTNDFDTATLMQKATEGLIGAYQPPGGEFDLPGYLNALELTGQKLEEISSSRAKSEAAAQVPPELKARAQELSNKLRKTINVHFLNGKYVLADQDGNVVQ